MKTLRKLTGVLALVAGCAAFGSTPAWAAPATRECTLVGAWMGHAGSTLLWQGVHTQGALPGNGQMTLDWVYAGSSLIDPAVRLTGGHGVWTLVARNQYRYTWYAYGVDAYGSPIYGVRVRGLATTTTCDHVAISYTFEVFLSIDDMSGDPDGVIEGDAEEYRLPVVTP